MEHVKGLSKGSLLNSHWLKRFIKTKGHTSGCFLICWKYHFWYHWSTILTGAWAVWCHLCPYGKSHSLPQHRWPFTFHLQQWQSGSYWDHKQVVVQMLNKVLRPFHDTEDEDHAVEDQLHLQMLCCSVVVKRKNTKTPPPTSTHSPLCK